MERRYVAATVAVCIFAIPAASYVFLKDRFVSTPVLTSLDVSSFGSANKPTTTSAADRISGKTEALTEDMLVSAAKPKPVKTNRVSRDGTVASESKVAVPAAQTIKSDKQRLQVASMPPPRAERKRKRAPATRVRARRSPNNQLAGIAGYGSHLVAPANIPLGGAVAPGQRGDTFGYVSRLRSSSAATDVDRRTVALIKDEQKKKGAVKVSHILRDLKTRQAELSQKYGADAYQRLSGLYRLGRLDDFVQEMESRERFAKSSINAVKSVQTDPVSTFSIDVDTASYSFVRRALQGGHLPTHDAVRVEELINYFDYDYLGPDTAEVPFKANVSVAATPWNSNTKLLHIGIKGYDVAPTKRPKANLVFLIDVSGSMSSPDKLPLLKQAFLLLLSNLQDEDTVSIVTYAGQAGTVLEPTSVKQKHKIIEAIGKLRSGGSTAGAQGITQAYALAERNLNPDGVNRVILATDGDFNVGVSSVDALKTLIEDKRKSGIFLSVLGFGRGNYNDALMQALAQNGNGTAAYIDTLREANKVLVEEASSTLFPIAKDVKIQIEFNPATIAEYRLIGYETRHLNRADFNNDRVDAGDIGSGHTVTAIYEITPIGSPDRLVENLRYKRPTPARLEQSNSDEIAFLKLRYKQPKGSKSKLITVPVRQSLVRDSIDALPDDLRFSVAVAAFGQKLRGNPFLDGYDYKQIEQLAASARGKDGHGYRAEFLSLVRTAALLQTTSILKSSNR